MSGAQKECGLHLSRTGQLTRQALDTTLCKGNTLGTEKKFVNPPPSLCGQTSPFFWSFFALFIVRPPLRRRHPSDEEKIFFLRRQPCLCAMCPRSRAKCTTLLQILLPRAKHLKEGQLTVGPWGGGGGQPTVRTRNPGHWLGFPCTRKKLSGPGSKSTHSIHNRQKNCDQPPKPSQKSGTWVRAGGRVETKNSSGGHFVSQNDHFTRGWTSIITHWGKLRECLRLI